jgi:hypothetical protein
MGGGHQDGLGVINAGVCINDQSLHKRFFSCKNRTLICLITLMSQGDRFAIR